MKRRIVSIFVCLATRAFAGSLLVRDSSCPDSSFSQCSGSNLPSDFCCPSNTKCMPLNGGSSIICCPAGQDCSFIAPITCDISQQNATAHPENPVHSTNLSATLDTCGGGCCPQGYRCQDSGCAVTQQSSSPSSSITAPTSTQTLTTSTPSNSAKPDALSSHATATPATAASTLQCEAFPGKAVVAGFFPGVIAGGLMVAAGMLLCGRRRKISPPIYQNQNICRSDFLRQGSARRPMPLSARSFSTKSLSPKSLSPRSLFRKSDAPTEATSMEFVLSEAPLRASQMTAFTDLMEGVGFRRGEPYLVATEGRSPRNKDDGKSRDV